MRFIKILTIHQWLKNLLIFIPLLSIGSFNHEEYKKVLPIKFLDRYEKFKG